MTNTFQIGDKVYASDWCYGTIVDIDTERDLVSVEFETSSGGGTASFATEDVRLEEQEPLTEVNMLEKIINIIAGVTEAMDTNAPCSYKKPMSPAYCKKCKFNEARANNLGCSCDAYNKAKALVDAGMCIRSDLIDQIFADIDAALTSNRIPAHVRGIEYIPDCYESDLAQAIQNIRQKYKGQQ